MSITTPVFDILLEQAIVGFVDLLNRIFSMSAVMPCWAEVSTFRGCANTPIAEPERLWRPTAN